MSLRGSDSDRGNLLYVSESAAFMLLRGHLMGIAASHFVLLAMTCVLIAAPLNDHLPSVDGGLKTWYPDKKEGWPCIAGTAEKKWTMI